ncbi:UDP-N-acetylmuramate dehydrogenase [Lysobacter brunescens]|uniref:UDP-N-acetylenolpyruvoylglucosamine reductase n=1 Tax=Lysobacter brunescens TaxID=262323 RepID=A0ABW2YIF8_9GAMM
MSVRETVSAPLRNTFGVDARAGRLIEIDDANDLPALFAGALAGASPLVVGGGSNLLIVENPALALALTSRDIRIVRGHIVREQGDGAIVRADAGVEWHAFVLWTLEHGFAGLENLSLIPGTVGAAPIQNIGAYGVEVGERIHAVEVFERATGAFHRFDTAACAFAYRDSVFKHDLDRYLIVAVEFALPHAASLPSSALKLDYAGIREELTAMGIDAPDARTVAEAVIRLRRRKLPDPAVVGNAGSFFKNPIVPLAQAEALLADHPRLPVFRGAGDDSRKLSAAWLIDACDWKGRRSDTGSGDAGVSEQHALVLVNHGRASGAELLDLARRIAEDVQSRFGVAIEPEPRLIGAHW